MNIPPKEVLFNPRDMFKEGDTVYLNKNITEYPSEDTPWAILGLKGEAVIVRVVPSVKVKYDEWCIVVCHSRYCDIHKGFVVALEDIRKNYYG